jgi:hypothetical protein
VAFSEAAKISRVQKQMRSDTVKKPTSSAYVIPSMLRTRYVVQNVAVYLLLLRCFEERNVSSHLSTEKSNNSGFSAVTTVRYHAYRNWYCVILRLTLWTLEDVISVFNHEDEGSMFLSDVNIAACRSVSRQRLDKHVPSVTDT